MRNCAAWIGTTRAIAIERLVSLRQPAAAQSVVSSSRIILATPPLPRPRQPCPPNTTHPLQISSAVTTASAGRSARAPSVSSSKVCFFSFLLPFPGLSSNLDSFFRDRDEPSQLSDRRHQICQSALASVLARGSVHRPDPIPHTGTSEGRSPPAER